MVSNAPQARIRMARLRQQRRRQVKSLVGKFDAKLVKSLQTQKWRYRHAKRCGTLSQKVRKWEVAKQGVHSCTLYKCGKFQFVLRSGSTDESCLEEVFTRNVYGKSFMPGQVWLDLGAHRGLFALRAIMEGAREVATYEPHPENYQSLS